ncbi:MAG TPA: TonB family protein [Candidatus Kapabacteria bacterium]|nr:TonB family protein [Candidatus Kapabacteria bacterium]
MLYIAYNFLTIEPNYIYPIWRTKGVIITVPPPSILNDDPLPPAITVSLRAPSPNDIPVPVPKLIEPVELATHTSVGIPGNDPTVASVQATPGTQDPALKVSPSQVVIDEPGKGDWLDLSEDPRPIHDIQRSVEYPQNAQRTNIEGKVTVSALIGEEGKVIRVEVEKADHPWLTQAAIDAMMKMRFTPGRQGESAVKAWYTQTIQFKLNN